MKETELQGILDSNEYEDLLSIKQLQKTSLWSRASTLLNKIIRGSEKHPRFSKSTPTKYKDEYGQNMIYNFSKNAQTKSYIDKNGKCIVEHSSPEYFEHTSDGKENHKGTSLREIYDGAGKSGTPRIEEVSWKEQKMPDGTYQRVENRVLFSSMNDYIKHQEAIKEYKELMGNDVAIPPDVMNAHVKARVNVKYDEYGYDMKLDDFSTRYYKPGNTDFQLKAHTTSRIIKTKDGYTKDVTYRDPENYNNVLGKSSEQSQLHSIDDKHNLVEHSYSFESKDTQIKRFSVDTPQFMENGKLSNISKMSGEYLEVNGSVQEATGSQVLDIDTNNGEVTQNYTYAEKLLKEFNRTKESHKLINESSQNYKLEISDKGQKATFAMPDAHGYGATKENTQNLKNIFYKVSKSVGLTSKCDIYTAGIKSMDGMFFERSSAQQLSQIQVDSLAYSNYDNNILMKKSVEDHTLALKKNHEDLEER